MVSSRDVYEKDGSDMTCETVLLFEDIYVLVLRYW